MKKLFADENLQKAIKYLPMDRRTLLKSLGVVSLGGITGCMGVGLPSIVHSASNGVLAHELFGQGPVKVIVLHDWSVDVESDYRMIRPFFNPYQFTLAFVDVRGYGRSKTLEGDFSAEEISRDVRVLADRMEWERFSVIGHSMTGMAVQRMMVDIPERLISVVATTPIPASGFPVDEETFSFFESMATDDENFKAGMDGLTSQRYGTSWLDYKLTENRKTVSADAMNAYATMWSKTDFSAEVKGNATPVLVVYGQFDNEALRKDALGAVLKPWYPNLEETECLSGHYPMIESPVQYAEAVIGFLKRKHGVETDAA